jgi:hypothetical protein
MAKYNISSLQDCIANYKNIIPGLIELSRGIGNESVSDLIVLYERCLPLLEQAMWGGVSDFDGLLECYQSLHREQEALIEENGDDRHAFILSIPVADRPAHLKTCLESIYQQCEMYAYGGKASGRYRRIKVVVAEDSREQENIKRHMGLVDEYCRKGLQVIYFGQDEQYGLLQSIPVGQRQRLANILTDLPRGKFYLKGQAANRNLSYLKCMQLGVSEKNPLYYMVDSDQSFNVNLMVKSGERIVNAISYFHVLDRIFRTTDALVVTGKLVGDPPVSPSVMSVNYLHDVIAYFSSLAAMGGRGSCSFHALPERAPGDAAYHDMANLFGYRSESDIYPYRCRLQGEHDHIASLQNFSQRLNGFFFGEHITRRTYFNYRNGFFETTPARTVYPGNYIVNREGLKYIIPFGSLRLRMSGPTAGRLISAEIDQRFLSINMPHMHRRTSGSGLSNDYRPGVELAQGAGQHCIDLSNEFERQFFGDLMLFTTEALVKVSDVNLPFAKEKILEVIGQKEQELLELYQLKHQDVLSNCQQLNELVFNQEHWWLDKADLVEALQRVNEFINNIQRNFGDQSLAWRQIQSSEYRAARKQQIVEALMSYRSERDVWDLLVQQHC